MSSTNNEIIYDNGIVLGNVHKCLQIDSENEVVLISDFYT